MSILFNNHAMAMEFGPMKLSREKYKTTDISGNYCDWAKALGAYSERVTDPSQVAHAHQRTASARRRKASRCCSSS